MVDKKEQGRLNKQTGARWEIKVRDDLIKKKWNVSKFQSNVELPHLRNGILPHLVKDAKSVEVQGKLIPAKRKFNPFSKAMMISSGFPDFICWKNVIFEGINERTGKKEYAPFSEVIGVEAKSNGYLTKEEKYKCEWLLKNNIFSKIFIAKKKKEGRKVIPEYIDFREKYMENK